MPSNISVTKKMLVYAKAHKLTATDPSLVNPFWGEGKRVLAYRVSGHMHDKHKSKVPLSALKTPELVASLFPNLLPEYAIHDDYHAVHKSGTRSLSSVRLIVLHDMESTAYDTAAEGVGNYFEMASSGGSTNYGVDNNSIQCYLPDNIIPWGAPYANTRGLHIEQMGKASWTTAQWHKLAAGTLDRTAWLIAQKSKKLGIPIRTLSDAQVKAGSKGVTTHKQVTRAYHVYGGHTDPGDGYPLGFVLDLARKYL